MADPSLQPSSPTPVGIIGITSESIAESSLRASGNASWPFEPEGLARTNLDLIFQAARIVGFKVPEQFHFHAGQVFYRNSHPIEVRLAGGIPGKLDATGQPTFTSWSTPIQPALKLGLNNNLILARSDRKRPHLSALVVENEKSGGQLDVAFLWDLRANTRSYNTPEVQPASLPLLRDEHFTVMSAGHYQAVREALYKNTFQQVDGSPWPTALLEKGPAHGQVQLRPAAMDDQSLIPPEKLDDWAQLMWKHREELSDLDADVLDALSALWLYQARNPQDDATADIDELLAMRGLKPKRSGQGRLGGYRPEQRTAMLKALEHVQNLWLNMAEVEVYNNGRGQQRRRKPTRQTIQSRAFVITDRLGQLRLDGWMDVEEFIFRPGKVFAYFLYGMGRQTALLSARALTYDPYRQTWEKRLTRYLSWQWRTRAHAGNYTQSYRVETLLNAIGQHVNTRRSAWQRERLEKALDTIHADEAIAAWQYEHMDESYWPRSTVLIEPPDIIRETYHRIEQPEKRGRKNLSVSNVLGERIRHRRRELRLSQIQAADQLEISQAYLSLLERGKKEKYSAKLQKKLEKWLEAP